MRLRPAPATRLGSFPAKSQKHRADQTCTWRGRARRGREGKEGEGRGRRRKEGDGWRKKGRESKGIGGKGWGGDIRVEEMKVQASNINVKKKANVIAL